MSKSNSVPTLFQSNGSWYFYTYDGYGKRRKIATGTKDLTEAEKFRKEFMKAPVVQIEKRRTLKSCLIEFTDTSTNPKYQESKITGKMYSHLHAVNMELNAKRLVQLLPAKYLTKAIRDISRIDCIEIRKRIWQEYGSSSVAYNVWKGFKTILSYCSQSGYIMQSPAAGLDNISYEKKKRAAIPAEDIRTIMDTDVFLSDEYRAFFILLATTGMRRGEAAAICTRQVRQFKGINELCINRARKDDDWKTIGLPKMNIIRTIPLADITYEALKPLLKPDRPDELIFPTLTRQGIGLCFNRIRAISSSLDLIAPNDVASISPHILRHSLNTELVLSNVNNLLVQEYLSWHHQDLGTQEVYTHIYARNLLPVSNAIDSIFGGNADGRL